MRRAARELVGTEAGSRSKRRVLRDACGSRIAFNPPARDALHEMFLKTLCDSCLKEEMYMVIPAYVMTKDVEKKLKALEKRVAVLEQVVKKLSTKVESQ